MAKARRLSRRLLPLVPLALLAAGFLLLPWDGDGSGGERPSFRLASAELRSFNSCEALSRYARRHREAIALHGDLIVAGSGRLATGFAAVANSGTRSVALSGLGAAESAGASAPPRPSEAATNVQEAGVDEPDIVKSDGSRIFALAGNRLHAVEATRGPRLLGALSLPAAAEQRGRARGTELVLSGDRALVLANVILRRYEPGTLIVEVDVGDPEAMRVVRTLTVEGDYVSARLTGSTVRVVTSSFPEFSVRPHRRPRALPERAPGAASPDAASRGAPGWMPRAVLHDRASGETTSRPLASCREVRRPERFSGMGMLSVLTIDLERGLPAIDRDAVMTAGRIVYASEQSLYVGTEPWLGRFVLPTHAEDDPENVPEGSTAIHKLDISEPDRTEYRASGEVPGFMLSQWSLSEHEGRLRVASTAEPWMVRRSEGRSESFVTVLEERSDRLVEVGRVGGLGEGERIRAVRFLGDVGFVVTFRQIDPLFTLELSEPSRPRVLGELKIPGFSAYLHPLGDGRLLGVGQDATERGRLRGTQLSLFDVSDLRDPTRLDSLSLGRGVRSSVERDHHAFLYWAPERLAAVPVRGLPAGAGDERLAAAVGFRVSRDGIEELGRIIHERAGRPAVKRALIVGDRLFTLSARGLMAHDPRTLVERGWVSF